MSESTRDLKPLIQRVVDGHQLSVQESSTALDIIMSGEATPAQVGALLTALRVRGETIDEIAGFARTMRKHAIKVELPADERPVVDTCGTGGDAAGTFNISTTAAFVVAAAGVRVAKHGNRSMTQQVRFRRCARRTRRKGRSAPEQVVQSVHRETGFGFMFAQSFHPAMKYVGPVRREIGIRTMFNVLGPLTNPAGVHRQLIGVGDRRISEALAEVLALLGSERVLVVTSHDGLDEIGLNGGTDVVEFDRGRGKTISYSIRPSQYGLTESPRSDILGGSVEENVAITKSVLGGEDGPRRSVTLINAGAALYTAGVACSIEDGIQQAAVAIDTGAASEVLGRVVELSRSFEA